MQVYGLTGGIGSGKSTVARLLRELGAEIVDADEVARDVVRPGTPGLAQIVAAFGPHVLDGAGALDRKHLGALIFADEGARARLNAVIHPLIAAETTRRLEALAARGVPLVFYEAALLVENDAYHALAGLITVEADSAAQRARIQARDGLSPAEAARRLAAQASNEVRRAAADVVLTNDGSLEELAAAVQALWRRLHSGEPLRRLSN